MPNGEYLLTVEIVNTVIIYRTNEIIIKVVNEPNSTLEKSMRAIKVLSPIKTLPNITINITYLKIFINLFLFIFLFRLVAITNATNQNIIRNAKVGTAAQR